MLTRRTRPSGGALEDRQQASERFKTAPTVLVVTDIGGAYGCRVKQGAIRYAAERKQWKLNCSADFDTEALFRLDAGGKRVWNGMIVQTPGKLLDQLLQFEIPIVNVSDLRVDFLTLFPSVISDNAAIGRIGAEHLIEKGFHNLAFFGLTGSAYATQRHDGFVACVKRAGRSVDELWLDFMRKDCYLNLKKWLASLPRPTGIMASNDILAKQIVDCCASGGISMPWEIAVVGVDDDPMVCEAAAGPSSSVAVAAEQVGYEAARLLDGLMRGEVSPAKREPILIPPRSVVLRQSSDVVAADDPLVVQAVRFIRQRVTKPVTVTEIAEHVGVSSRALELRFRASMGCSPSAAIRQVRVEHVKRLMDFTEAPLHQIAGESGFRDLAYLSRVFRQVTGLHPQQYRDRTRQVSRGEPAR